MKKIILTLFFLIFLVINIFSQNDSIAKTDTTKNSEKIKKGLSFGVLPALAYDADMGFLYGVIVNVFHFGDGSDYPNYDHSLYMEWSRTTKGSGKNQLVFDSRKLIKGIRTTAEIAYFTEQALDFYGFNGRPAEFNPNYIDENSDEYKSRLYYRYARKYLLLRADFQGNLYTNKLRWMAGFTHSNNTIESLDIERLNKGKSESDTLPNVNTLYDDYVEWNVFNKDEISGGSENQIKLGLIYDTRDNEANPMKGIWEELMIVTVPSFLGNKHSYAKLVINHHQYFTLIKKKMNFAYRISYQPKIFGEIPFYSLPFLQSSYRVRDGLGGSKSLRGIYRNRIVGNDFLFANFEVRWKFYETSFLNQNFYIAFFPYLDAGMITKKYQINTNDVPVDRLQEFNAGTESFHLAYGGGLAFALNHNFIVNVTYGMSNEIYDGRNSLYITLNFLF